MNSLSWLIYLADVSGNLRNVAGGGLAAASMAATLGAAVLVLSAFEKKTLPKGFGAATAAGFFFTGLFSIAMVVTPAPATVYMIAASEAGEAIAETPSARELLESLREIIARKLKAELGEVRT